MMLNRILQPQSVAVVGSAAPGKLANILAHRLQDGGMKRLFAVNPKAQGVGSIPGFHSLQEVGEPVDLAVIAAPSATVPGVMEDCGKAGVRAAIIISSGFSEVGNRALEDEVKRIAEKYGIRYVGPNCAGVANPHANLVATIETAPIKGSIAILSQSGAVGGAFMAMAAERRIGISKFLSFGNGSDLGVLDFLQYLKDDPDTKVIALYLESIGDGRAFMKILREVTRKKPVVLVKAGRTGTGQRAALSHTGSMAGADAVFDAAMKQCGVIRVDTLEDLFSVCRGFSMMAPVAGKRLLIVTNSGGPGVMSTDRAEKCGLQVAEPDDSMRERLASALKANAAVKNPIDLTVEGTGEQYREALVTALDSYDSALALYVGTPYLKALPVAEGIAAAAKESGKPVAAVLLVGADIEESRAYLNARGVPVFSQGENAVEVLSQMERYVMAAIEEDLPCPPLPSEQKWSDTLLEPQAMKLLESSDIPVPVRRFVAVKEEVAPACAELGYPVVMKVVSPQILHKSDVGGVILHIADVASAESAFDRLAAVGAGKDFRGVMIYPMLRGGTEIILGLTRDPQFGPVVVCGLGGIYTEVLKDVVFRVAPVSEAGAQEMVESIRASAILKGIRGQSAVDLDKLAKTISAFSRLPFLYPQIQEADLNPVIARTDGVVAADVRILCKKLHS
ncbi:MAG: acetate--CoA ligase family protein [Ethanoligenens sp.]